MAWSDERQKESWKRVYEQLAEAKRNAEESFARRLRKEEKAGQGEVILELFRGHDEFLRNFEQEKRDLFDLLTREVRDLGKQGKNTSLPKESNHVVFFTPEGHYHSEPPKPYFHERYTYPLPATFAGVDYSRGRSGGKTELITYIIEEEIGRGATISVLEADQIRKPVKPFTQPNPSTRKGFMFISHEFSGSAPTLLNQDNPSDLFVPITGQALLDQVNRNRRECAKGLERVENRVRELRPSLHTLNLTLEYTERGIDPFFFYHHDPATGESTKIGSHSGSPHVTEALRDRLKDINRDYNRIQSQARSLEAKARLISLAPPTHIFYINSEQAESLNFPVPPAMVLEMGDEGPFSEAM